MSIDEFGVQEALDHGLDALTSEVLARRPELILINPRATELHSLELLALVNGTQPGGGAYRLDLPPPEPATVS
ncbi:MAG: hypothetical protein ACRDF8_13120 [Chloroflexota bacterium]